MPARQSALLPCLQHSRQLVGALLLCLTTPALAEPAPWFVWRSKLNGHEHCAQASPGPGWERVRGPYRDVRCSQPAAATADPRRPVPTILPPAPR